MHVGQAHVQQEGSPAGAEMREPDHDLPEGPGGPAETPEPLWPRKDTSVYNLQRQHASDLVSGLKSASHCYHPNRPLTLIAKLTHRV